MPGFLFWRRGRIGVMRDAAGQKSTAPVAIVMDPPRTFRRVPLLPHQLLDRITAQRDLFVLAHVGVPRIDVKTWTLSVTGLVRDPATFTFDQIRQMPKKQVEAFHECAGYPSNPKIATRRVGNVVWGGVDLKTFLEALGVLPEARSPDAYASLLLHACAVLGEGPATLESWGDSESVLEAYEDLGFDVVERVQGWELALA